MLPELGRGRRQDSSGSSGSFPEAGRTWGEAPQLVVPGTFLDTGWSLKSPTIPATLVLPLDFGGPGLGDQPSHKPAGGRGRSYGRNPEGGS